MDSSRLSRRQCRIQFQERHAARNAFPISPSARDETGALHTGRDLDIIVDLRPESPTSCSISVELNEENGRALYVPERFAHGYQTLRDNTETSYQVGEFYAPDYESGLM